jgi:hypothetical protein
VKIAWPSNRNIATSLWKTCTIATARSPLWATKAAISQWGSWVDHTSIYFNIRCSFWVNFSQIRINGYHTPGTWTRYPIFLRLFWRLTPAIESPYLLAILC